MGAFRLLVMLCLTSGSSARALLATNLVADWQGNNGITAPGGRVFQWTDQHQALNPDGLGPHVLTQSNATYQPYAVTDAHGYAGVEFPWGYLSASPNTFMNLPPSLSGLDTKNSTVYVVSTGPLTPQNQTLIWFGGSSAGWINFYQNSNFPPAFSVGPQASTLYPTLNPAVFVGSGSSNQTTIRWNYATQTFTAQAEAVSGHGGMLAANNSSAFYFGIIYRVLVYKAAHTPAQMDAQVGALTARYGVLTNYTKHVVCRGASSSEGVGSTMLQSYPFQLWQRYPDIAWHNQGLGGEIGTNGLTGSMYDQDGSFVDLLFNDKLQENWLFVLGGINDINAGLSGRATWERLTNYVTTRKAAHPWTVVVCTIQNDVLEPTTNADYNACIRTNGGPWDRFVDPGLNSPIESRLNDPHNTNYFISDGVHLTNLGYSVMADHFGQIVNVPHRATGSFGP